MAIYDASGNALSSVYDASGTELLNAYDARGTVIYTRYAPEPTGEVAIHGKLRKVGKYLVDKNGRQMEIRGVGTHHLLQYTNLHTYDAINSLKSYGVNCLRICAYLEDWDFASSDGEIAYGYVSHPTETKAEIEKLIDICVSLGMYILLDWHVLGNGTNGQSAPTGAAAFHQTEAEEFFTYFSSKYANLPNMMYELANEPYKSTYAQCVSFVTAIRNIITANVDDPIMVMNGPSANGASTMYDNLRNAGITDVFVSNHQYGQNQVTNYTNQWNNNYPLFNTEWGNSSSSGDGAGSDANAIAMLEWHHTYGVPHAVWKYTDQTMATSLLKNLGTINSSTYANGFDDDDLSHNGTLFLKRFQLYATTDYIERDVVS